ncbi:2-hydroxyacyl-CoA dehydratase [Parasutterella excrementihominis]|jgi:benzoyl-CoA reductase/2-hydroxyglutaryl-CoA dehydratase subunit BcrC/BadD/HgdB
MCDLWAFEHFLMRKRLHENNVPFLELEVDYTPEGQGQIKTRVQAFVESLADRQTA